MVKVTVEAKCDGCGKTRRKQFTVQTPEYVENNDCYVDDFDYLTSENYPDMLFCGRSCYKKYLLRIGNHEAAKSLDNGVWIA